MKSKYFFSVAAFFSCCLTMGARAQVAIDETHFPDPAFRGYVMENFDTDADGSLSEEECQAVIEIDGVNMYGVSSLKGIEYFPSLRILNCGNSCLEMTSLDVSKNPALTSLNCGSTKITSLDLSKNPALEELVCSYTSLTSLDVSQNPALTSLDCRVTDITSLDVNRNPALTSLDCSVTEITNLDLSKNPALKRLFCAGSPLSVLDLSANLDLEDLDCSDTRIDNLDLTKNTKLKFLDCSGTQLAGLDLSKNNRLEELACENLCVGVMKTGEGKADLATLPGFDPERAIDWKGGSLSGQELTFGENNWVEYKYLTGYAGSASGLDTVLFTLIGIEKAPVPLTPEYFPDESFRNYIQEQFDHDGSGALELKELAAVKEIDLMNFVPEGMQQIRSLGGLEYFPFLRELLCDESFVSLAEVNLSQNPFLKDLWVAGTGLKSLDVSRNAALEQLYLMWTDISELNVTQNPNLKLLGCYNTLIKRLDLSQNSNLEELWCGENENLMELVLGNTSKMRTLSCPRTGIKALDLSRASSLSYLECDSTSLTSLDLSQNMALEDLYAESFRCEVKAEVGGTYDLSRLPGFDVSRASEWKGGSVQGNILTFQDTAVTYQYETRYAGEGEEIPSSLEFKLVANPDAEEDVASSVSMQAVPFLAYAREGVLYLQGTQGTVEVFNLQGVRVYHGNKTSVKLPSQGVYLVRNQGYTRKVLNLM